MKRFAVMLLIPLLISACDEPKMPKFQTASGSEVDPATLKGKIKKIQEEIAGRREELSKQRNTEDKLTKYLSVDNSRGCFLQEPIRSLEILVNGNLPGPRSLGTGNAMKDQGDADKVAFKLGNDITITSDVGIMRPNGTISNNSFSGKKVADIEDLTIEKMGSKFFNDRKCHQSCSLFVICKSSCKTQISELNSFSLSSIEVKINDKTIYKNDSVGKSFTFGDRILVLKDLKNRPEYLDALAIQDCASK